MDGNQIDSGKNSGLKNSGLEPNSSSHFDNRIQRLSKEEELEIIARAQSENDQDAIAVITEQFQPLIISIANQYRNRGVGLGDLVSQGNVGFMQALQGFNPSKDARMITYAYPWIKQAIQRLVIRSRHINLPPEKWRKLVHCLALMDAKDAKTVSELAGELEVTPKQLQEILRAKNELLSLDSVSDQFGTRLSEFVPGEEADPEQAAMDLEMQEKMHVWRSQTCKTTQEILSLRDQEYSFNEIATHMTKKSRGKKVWNRERVRVYVNRAKRSITKKMRSDAFDDTHGIANNSSIRFNFQEGAQDLKPSKKASKEIKRRGPS